MTVRYVVFVSEADDLVANDMNGIADVCVRDLQNRTTTLASVGAVSATRIGSSAAPVITADGRCFQIVDDVLDLTSDFGGLKDQKRNDIYEGKRTIMLGHLFRSVKGEDKRKLDSIMSKPREQKTQDEVDWVIAKMQEAGSLDHAKAVAAELKERALGIFENDLTFLSNEPARGYLKTLISFVLERDH